MIYAPWEYREYGEGVQVFEHCTILKPQMISLLSHCRVDARVRIEGGLGVTIGEHTHIASGSCLNTGGGELWFGAHSGCSVNVVIATGNPDLSYLKISAAEPAEDCHVVRKKTVIGEYVVIFAGAVVCPGVEIGDKAVVAAGAVVTKNVPARAIVAGVPARIIGYRSITKQ